MLWQILVDAVVVVRWWLWRWVTRVILPAA
jgi:hypothetical protein